MLTHNIVALFCVVVVWGVEQQKREKDDNSFFWSLFSPWFSSSSGGDIVVVGVASNFEGETTTTTRRGDFDDARKRGDARVLREHGRDGANVGAKVRRRRRRDGYRFEQRGGTREDVRAKKKRGDESTSGSSLKCAIFVVSTTTGSEIAEDSKHFMKWAEEQAYDERSGWCVFERVEVLRL